MGDSDIERDLGDELRDTPRTLRRALLLDRINAMLVDIVGRDDLDSLSETQRFFELGVGSLVIVELKGRLESALDVDDLPVSLFFKHASVGELADHLLTTVAPAAEPEAESSTTPEAASGTLESELAELSEEEAEARMLAKLDELDRFDES